MMAQSVSTYISPPRRNLSRVPVWPTAPQLARQHRGVWEVLRSEGEMERGEVVGTGMGGGMGVGGGRKQARGWKLLSSMPDAESPDSRIEGLLEEPIGKIAPEIYGHFAEHLGGVIYHGIWVGENSKIPNIGDIRKALVEAMRRIRPAATAQPAARAAQ